MATHPSYKELMDTPANYEVWAVCGKTDVHRFLMIKGEGTVPYVTIEIKTNDWVVMTPVIRPVTVNHRNILLQHPENVGTYGSKGETLRDLCQNADSVATKMGVYNALNSNCQHFCNDLLKTLGFDRTFTTIFGTDTTLYEEKKDKTATIVGEITKELLSSAIREPLAAVANKIGGLDKPAEVYMP